MNEQDSEKLVWQYSGPCPNCGYVIEADLPALAAPGVQLQAALGHIDALVHHFNRDAIDAAIAFLAACAAEQRGR